MLNCAASRRMEVDDNEGDVGSRLRPIFCSLGEITRADGSVMLCQVVTQAFPPFFTFVKPISGRYNCSLQCLWSR